MRLGLSATAGSAVLYGAIVVFGIGSASPSALDVDRDPHASVVLVPQHADIVPGSVRKLPQASPEPGRHRSRMRTHSRGVEVGLTASPAQSTVERPSTSPQPAATRAKESTSPAVTSSSTAPVAEPIPILTVPALAVPTLTVPELPAPLPALPVPPLPELTVTPPVLPLDLPG